jgi:hypothetical protein
MTLERAAQRVAGLRRLAADSMTTWMSILHFPDLPFVPDPVRGRSFAVVLGAFSGSEAKGRELLSALRGDR